MPYCMTEPTEDHIWGKEYLKSTVVNTQVDKYDTQVDKYDIPSPS